MKLDPKQSKRFDTEKRRGWIIYLLYVSKPKPLDFSSVIIMMDQRNMPMSHRRFAEEIDFLRSAGMLRVFPIGAVDALTEVEQSKLIQRYCDSEGELDDDYCAKITTRGINFHEGHFDETGVRRVN